MVPSVAHGGAQPQTFCPPGESPRFVFGFANLKEYIGEPMGDAVTCEFPDPNGTGDVHQRTSTGLAFWRKSTNAPAFTTGWEHWGQTPTGWAYWTGSNIDPPSVLPPLTASAPTPIELSEAEIAARAAPSVVQVLTG